MHEESEDDLDEIVRELNASPLPVQQGSRTPAAASAAVMPGDASRLERLLRLVSEQHAADLLLVAGAPPMVRIDGRVRRLDDAPLDGVEIEEIVIPALPPHARRLYRDAQIADASFRILGV